MNKIIFLLLCNVCIVIKTSVAKPEVDSLMQALNNPLGNREKTDLLISIANQFARSNFDKAVYYGNEALALATKLKYSKGESEALYALGYVHYYRSNYNVSMEILFRKLRLDDSLGNKNGMASTYNLIGNIYYYNKDYSKAREYYNKSLELFKSLHNEEGQGNIYTCLANINEANKEFQKAEHFYLTGLAFHKKVNDITDIVVSYTNLGNLYFRDYADTAALQYFKKAISYLPKITNASIHVFVYGNLGDYYLWHHQLDSALFILDKGFTLAKVNSLPIYIGEISNSLSKLYAEKRNFEKAYQFQKIYERYNDSIFNSTNSSKMAFLDYEYTLQKQENLRTIDLLKQQRKAKTRLWIFITLFILAASITGFIILYNGNRMKQEKLLQANLNIERFRLEELLGFRDKEIMIITTNLFERNELIRMVIMKLKSLIPNLKHVEQTMTNEIIRDLKGKYHENVIAEFEYRFQNVHDKFYDYLSEDFPALTSNDLRLCAFLKMNLNTKDIASITHQTTNTVEVARTRLRKKLNIDHLDTDLALFLSKY